ncbi:hypothetical protein ACWDXV_18190 [Nocardia nova]
MWQILAIIAPAVVRSSIEQPRSVGQRGMVVITRDEHGVFEACWGGERFVRGWSATVGEMVAILHRYGLVEPDLTAAGVSAAPVDDSEGDRAGRLDGDYEEWHRLLRSRADGPQRARLRDALVALRTQIPADRGGLRMWLAERTEMVNAQAPQVDRVAVFQNGGPVRCDSVPEFPARVGMPGVG